MSKETINYNDWKRLQTDVGCMFARTIAFAPANFGQKLEVVRAASSPAAVARSIDRKIRVALEERDTQASVLILPGIATLEMLTLVAIKLRELPDWTVCLTELQDSKIGPAVSVGVNREIPTGRGGATLSEALVFGPFQCFPRTRRAPVVAFELFVGVPMELDPKGAGSATKANLAHMKIPAIQGSAFRNMWEMSRKGRSKSLDGSDDTRAKAKVSFIVPHNMAQSLGCLS